MITVITNQAWQSHKNIVIANAVRQSGLKNNNISLFMRLPRLARNETFRVGHAPFSHMQIDLSGFYMTCSNKEMKFTPGDCP